MRNSNIQATAPPGGKAKELHKLTNRNKTQVTQNGVPTKLLWEYLHQYRKDSEEERLQKKRLFSLRLTTGYVILCLLAASVVSSCVIMIKTGSFPPALIFATLVGLLTAAWRNVIKSP